jgi:exosortase/archaeosortase family protein
MRSLWTFLLAFTALYAGHLALRDSDAGLAFINAVTVLPASWLLQTGWPAEGVRAVGERLAWPGGSLGLSAGCDGFEVMTVFAAGVLVAPLSAARRALLLLLGIGLLWALNQARVLALVYAYRHERGWFDALHSLWAPLLLVAAAFALYRTALSVWRPAA